jgi:PEP-CTERM motif
MRFLRQFVLLTVAAMVCCLPVAADQIAVFGNNNLYNVINATDPGEAVLVSDAQLATPGFLSGFNAVLITRDGAGFGTSLSAAAAANVAAFVGSYYGQGNIALFSADWTDIIGTAAAPSGEDTPGNPDATLAFLNAVQWAMQKHGYIGEFNGAATGLLSNSNGLNVFGFVTGSADFLNCAYNVPGTITVTQPGHPIMAGVSGSFSTKEFPCRSSYSGVDPANVLATFENGDPAIVVNNVPNVPEPATIMLLGSGLAGLLARRRGK